MSISTRRGDFGETDMLFGCRVKKSYARIDAIGGVDELNAALGLFRVTAKTETARREIPRIQSTLIALMGELATPPGEELRYSAAHAKCVDEAAVDHLDALVHDLEMAGALQIKGWALPGAEGVISAAHADLARTVCRRAERSVVLLEDSAESVPNVNIVRYLNRLSDVLWLMARMEEKTSSKQND